jgi:hypothetical protein
MNKLRIEKIHIVGKKYVVYLDSDYKYEFSSQKDAEKFCRKLTKKLSGILYQLNEAYSRTFILNRQYYFIIDSRLKRNTIKKEFENIDYLFESAIQKYNSENADSFKYTQLKRYFTV